MRSRSQAQQTVVRCGASIAAVCAVATLCRKLPLNATAVSLIFLLVVLIIATQWRLSAAIVASLTATVFFNFFFLPPVGTLTIADPQNWIALVAFLLTAVIASELSNRAQRQAEAAVEQSREVERLYEMSRGVLLDTGESALGSTIAQQIAATFGFDAVLYYDLRSRRAFHAGQFDIEAPVSELEGVQYPTDLADGSRATSVRLGNKPVGVLAIRGDVGTTALEAIANLVAITVECAASQEIPSQARAARRSEQLKSSILDALAHEFKTPLTSIKAASTTLLSKPSIGSESDRELLTIIDEEADRLTSLVTEAIQVSHIEAGRVRLKRSSTDASALLESVTKQMKPRMDDRELRIETDAQLPRILVDQELMQLAIRQLVDNAMKYSRPGSPITLQARAAGNSVQLGVRDVGPGIAAHEQQRIFEKFYRGEAIRQKLPGTGVGLNIVKDIVNAHSGRIVVSSAENAGTTFTIELPGLTEARA